MKDVDIAAESTTTKTETSSQNTLTVNKVFIVNTLKQVDDHNRIKDNQESKLLRKFQNEQRKKLTLKNLNRFSAGRTLYSDLIFVASKKRKRLAKRMKIISPLDQVKKLVSDAAEYDVTHQKIMKRMVHKPRVTLDKTLLKNHLRHTSVHNRIREETEMWDQYQSQEKKKNSQISLQTQRSKTLSLRTGIRGGMYSDREPGNVKVTRVKTTPDDPPIRHFGAATRKLLELEESMPDRWGHSGFKETYEKELNEPSPDSSKSRQIIVSNSLSDRLNSSIELSDDEIEVQVRNNKHKVRKVLKRSLKANSRKIMVNKAIAPVHIGKKSFITTAFPKLNKAKRIGGKQKFSKLGSVKTKKIIVERSTPTLQSDMIIAAEKRQRRNIKRDVSPKWEHDGFQEIINDSEEEGESDDDISIRESAKSRLGVLRLSDDDSDDISTDSLKMNSRRRKIIAVKNRINQRSRSKNVVSDQGKSEGDDSPVEVSDSEEWTEKEVNRTTLKNSIHEEKGKLSIKSRLGQKRKSPCKTSHEDSGDSSFTDSSGDERYKERIDMKRKRVLRFSNHQNR